MGKVINIIGFIILFKATLSLMKRLMRYKVAADEKNIITCKFAKETKKQKM